MQWKAHLPDLKGNRILLVPFFWVLIIVSWNFSFLMSVFIPRNLRILGKIEPYLSMIVMTMASSFGMSFASFGYLYRKSIIKRYRHKSYQIGLFLFMMAIGTVASLITSTLIPKSTNQSIGFFAKDPLNHLTHTFSVPIFMNLLYIRRILSIFLLYIGARTSLQCLRVFGIDNTLGTYIYFPEESNMIEHEIYGVIRNPMYLGFMIMAIGGSLFHFTIYSLFSSFCAICCLCYLVYFLEEPELKNRYGSTFIDYCKTTPSFLIPPSKFDKYLRFLFTNPNKNE